MARFISLAILFLYFLFSTGVAVNVHYCKGKIASIQIENSAKENKCSNSKGNCCKDELHVLKVNAHSGNALTKTEPLNFTFITNIYFSGINYYYYSKVVAPILHPPQLSPPKLWVKNGVFRI